MRASLTYSARSDTTGSTAEARRAGTYDASSDAAAFSQQLPQEGAGMCADRDPDAELARPPRHDVRLDAVYAEDGQLQLRVSAPRADQFAAWMDQVYERHAGGQQRRAHLRIGAGHRGR